MRVRSVFVVIVFHRDGSAYICVYSLYIILDERNVRTVRPARIEKYVYYYYYYYWTPEPCARDCLIY